jgi:hypothetical protein
MVVRCQVVQKDGKEFVEEIHKIIVHKFTMADVDDPEIYAAEPIWKWQQTEAGKFVMENSASEPVFHQARDHLTYNVKYVIVAELEKKKLSEFYLRFGKVNA